MANESVNWEQASSFAGLVLGAIAGFFTKFVALRKQENEQVQRERSAIEQSRNNLIESLQKALEVERNARILEVDAIKDELTALRKEHEEKARQAFERERAYQEEILKLSKRVTELEVLLIQKSK